jgi:hypothetical protein
VCWLGCWPKKLQTGLATSRRFGSPSLTSSTTGISRILPQVLPPNVRIPTTTSASTPGRVLELSQTIGRVSVPWPPQICSATALSIEAVSPLPRAPPHPPPQKKQPIILCPPQTPKMTTHVLRRLMIVVVNRRAETWRNVQKPEKMVPTRMAINLLPAPKTPCAQEERRREERASPVRGRT